jgi:hypothetical protein
MNWLRKSQLNGIKDEVDVIIEYDENNYDEPSIEKINVPISRSVSPNTVLYFKTRAKVPLKNNVQIKGKADVLGRIPCFREEVHEVYDLIETSSLKKLSDLLNNIQSDVTKRKLKLLSESVVIYE